MTRNTCFVICLHVVSHGTQHYILIVIISTDTSIVLLFCHLQKLHRKVNLLTIKIKVESVVRRVNFHDKCRSRL